MEDRWKSVNRPGVFSCPVRYWLSERVIVCAIGNARDVGRSSKFGIRQV